MTSMPSNTTQLKKVATESIKIIGDTGGFEVQLDKVSDDNGIQIFRLHLYREEAAELEALSLEWCLPAHNIKGVWSTNALHEKRLRADWEAPTVKSRVSVDAPVICLYGHQDENVQTFACSDVINTLVLEAPVREEDNLIYCRVRFFTEKMPATNEYEAFIRIETGGAHFGESLKSVGAWWAEMDHLVPMPTAEAAKIPLYSTWYAYHQSMTEEGLLRESEQALTLGYNLIIIDDGWQTMDTNRGYDYTGDWAPDRFPEMAQFVERMHGIGMKVMLWFSVPFCGVKSKAYQRFKGKFLTENHRWAPVFDPRYLDVREYLIEIYVQALQKYNLDGFKLDFIDDFKVYPETELTLDNGRDYASVNEAVDRLMGDVAARLLAIKPNILIEFRQKYIGPAMRKYGNMFRAFDCPNDSLTNRIRTTDVKLLCGNTAVHSDMFTWHYDEPVELSALQITSILFSVPQLSVRLAEISTQDRKMIRFYTQYWLRQRSVLLEGHFVASLPSANYPILSSSNGDQIIYGIYDNMTLSVDASFDHIDLVNGKRSEQIMVQFSKPLKGKVQVFNCQGELQGEAERNFDQPVHLLNVPPAGMIFITKTKNL